LHRRASYNKKALCPPFDISNLSSPAKWQEKGTRPNDVISREFVAARRTFLLPALIIAL
jgi:hypothetical protein